MGLVRFFFFFFYMLWPVLEVEGEKEVSGGGLPSWWWVWWVWGWIGSWVVALSVMGFANHAQFHFANHAPVSFKKSLTISRPIDYANNRGRLAFSTFYLLRLRCLFWVLAGRLGFFQGFFFFLLKGVRVKNGQIPQFCTICSKKALFRNYLVIYHFSSTWVWQTRVSRSTTTVAQFDLT